MHYKKKHKHIDTIKCSMAFPQKTKQSCNITQKCCSWPPKWRKPYFEKKQKTKKLHPSVHSSTICNSQDMETT